MKKRRFAIYILFIFALSLNFRFINADTDFSYYQDKNSYINIKNANGKFYAYILLLFEENPYFINMIQEDSISTKGSQPKTYFQKEYEQYAYNVKNRWLQSDALKILSIFKSPRRYSNESLTKFEKKLESRNIILKFQKPLKPYENTMQLTYCIFGTKRKINNEHPFFRINEEIYNIIPLIPCDDQFITSNSTFYFDMIYINSEEVQNDYIIAKKILSHQNVSNHFYVGAQINDDIIYCIKKAFSSNNGIKQEINTMFEVHELTHKILNNRYNFFDQVIGEELALSATIYKNPFLGLSVMYSYLDYNQNNPHKLGALNYIRYISNAYNNSELYDDPSKIKYLSSIQLKKLTKQHFESFLKVLE